MTYQTVKILSPLDAGYLAGLIDGEGTITTLSRRNHNKQRGLVVTISNTEMSILMHVQKITGVGKITNKRIAKAHHTPSFTYQATNRQALDILKQIADHLRSYKADRARLALQDYTRLTPRNGRYSPVQLRFFLLPVHCVHHLSVPYILSFPCPICRHKNDPVR
jgi:hypothetical protein